MDYKHLNIAHTCARQNKGELIRSRICGCFYCQEIFSPTIIKEYTDNNDTAICPFCHIDSIVGDASGFDITPQFLRLMYQRWFGHGVPKDQA